MMADHLSALEQQENLNKQRDQLETTADDAASLLLDLMDLEQSQDTTERRLPLPPPLWTAMSPM